MGRKARLGCLRKGRGRPVGTDWLSALLLFLGGPAASERCARWARRPPAEAERRDAR